MVTLRSWLVALSVTLSFAGEVVAQHCAPITESYLSGIQLERQADGLQLSLQYSKTGGRRQRAYQAYLVAFPERLSAQVAELTPQRAIEKKLVTVIQTQLIPRDAAGQYQSQWKLETEPLVEQLITADVISADRVNDVGGWKSYQDQLRFAVFIPFLEDDAYSNLEGLPADTHECNYAGEAALLYERLPQSLTVCFGIVQAVRLEERVHYLQFNGHRPAGEKTK